MANHLSPDEEAKYLRDVKYVRDMLFLDLENPIPGTTDRFINRKPHIYINDTAEGLVMKGKRRTWERGFETEDVSVNGNESLYRAISKALRGSEDHYQEIYRIGVSHMSISGLSAADYKMTDADFTKYVMEEDMSGLEIVKPALVLSALAKALSVRLVLFNAVGQFWVAQECVPSSGTQKERTAYALCVRTLKSLSVAYAATPLLPLTRLNPPAQPIDEFSLNRIWKQNTIPKSFSPPPDMEDRIKRIKRMSGIVDFRCLYKDKVEWSPPPSEVE